MTTSPMPSDVVRVSGPQGIIGAIPYLLGFHPEESLVLLCLRGNRHRMGPVLRIDLPSAQHSGNAARQQLAQYLAIQAEQHADSVMLVCYSESADTAVRRKRVFAHAGLIKECIKRIERCGVPVFDAALVRRQTCVSYLQHAPGEPGFPLPDEDDQELARLGSNHAGAGRAVLASRADLRLSIAGPQGAAQAHAELLLERARSSLSHRATEPEALIDLLCDLQEEHAAVRGAVRVVDRTARIIAALDHAALRDEAIFWALHQLDDAVVPLFIKLATWTPDLSCAQICSVLAVLAYRQGDGALAQVAVDRVLLVEPDHRLCGLLIAMMQAGMPPHLLDSMLSDASPSDDDADPDPSFIGRFPSQFADLDADADADDDDEADDDEWL